MIKGVLEYVWVDGNNQIRAKRRFIELGDWAGVTLNDCPDWSFDGSSTGQADGKKSDLLLKPRKIYTSPLYTVAIVFCVVEDNEGNIYNPEVTEANMLDDQYWFGFEQEFFLINSKTGYPDGISRTDNGQYICNKGPQGPYYCSISADNRDGEDILASHAKLCVEYDIPIVGNNAEVAPGQWEYQILSKGALNASRDLWVSRFVLLVQAANYGYDVCFDPKPFEGDINGSGLHTNFSNEDMRVVGGKENIARIISVFKNHHKDDITLYGNGNERRLTGKHETCHIDDFQSGVGNRTASIRIPPAMATDPSFRGYLEDRRPAANADPYLVTLAIVNNIEEAYSKG